MGPMMHLVMQLVWLGLAVAAVVLDAGMAAVFAACAVSAVHCAAFSVLKALGK